MPLGRSSRHLGLTMRNLVSSLIEHENVTTTMAKAKLLQNLAENLINKTKRSQLSAPDLKSKLYGELYNQDRTVPKLMGELKDRYQDRQSGYTRILKLEPRFGDNAPQAMVELVDNGEHEMKFWLTAKVVARLELQGEELDKLTQKNVDGLLKHRKNGSEEFRELVELCKKEFFKDEEQLKLKPRMKNQTNGFRNAFKNYEVVPRE